MKLLPAAFLGALAAAAAAADPPPEQLLDAITENLLKNAGPDLPSMDGWDDVVSGGDGWDAHIQTENCSTAEKPDPKWPRECERVFKTSYQACTRRQTVALEVPGKVDAALLDSGTVSVFVSEEVREFYKVDKFFVRAALCRDADCKHKVARWAPCKEESSVATEEGYQWCLTRGVEGKATADDRWRSHNYTFSAADVPGARYLLFEDGGVDSEYWTGWYGPWFKNAHVAVHKSTHSFAPTRSPAPTPKPRPTAAPVPRPTAAPGDADPTPRPTPAPKPKPHHHSTPKPTVADPFAGGAEEDSSGDTWKYVAFALLAIIGGFGLGFCIRQRRRDAGGGGAANPYAIAGTTLDDDLDEGVEMRGSFV